MPILAMSPEAWEAIKTFLIVAGPIVMIVLQQRHQNRTAEHLVKQDKKLTVIEATGNETKRLVDGAMSAQMGKTADAMEKTAEATEKLVDVKAAEVARTDFDAHEQAQKEEFPRGPRPTGV